jgi:ABC-type sulfate transport system permease subunit
MTSTYGQLDWKSFLSTGVASAFAVILLILFIVFLVAYLRIYKKAGKPQWAVIIPIYNLVVMMRIVKKPMWLIILAFISPLNIIFSILIAYYLAKAFGKGGWFAVGLIFLPIIFYPILAFGKSQYLLADDSGSIPPTEPSQSAQPAQPNM